MATWPSRRERGHHIRPHPRRPMPHHNISGPGLRVKASGTQREKGQQYKGCAATGRFRSVCLHIFTPACRPGGGILGGIACMQTCIWSAAGSLRFCCACAGWHGSQPFQAACCVRRFHEQVVSCPGRAFCLSKHLQTSFITSTNV
jgi:hypothetical protein